MIDFHRKLRYIFLPDFTKLTIKSIFTNFQIEESKNSP